MKKFASSAKDLDADVTQSSWVQGQEVEVEVTKAILNGKFMGEAPDGRVVWLNSPQHSLGISDRIRGVITKVAKRSFEVMVGEILSSLPSKQPVFCPHISSCGGCPWQALSIEQQIDTLQRDIGRMLERACGRELTWQAPFFDHGQEWRCTARLHSDGKGHLGFYGPQGIFDLDHCPVFVPELNQLLPLIRSQLLPLLTDHPAELRISTAEGSKAGTIALKLFGQWTESSLALLKEKLPQIVEKYAVIRGISLEAHLPQLLRYGQAREPHRKTKNSAKKKGRLPKGKRERVNRSKAGRRFAKEQDSHSAIPLLTPIIHSWGLAFNELPSTAHPATAFMQSHQRGNQALIAEVLEGMSEADNILELYAGSGNFTLPLAKAKPERSILALEYDPKAVESLNHIAQEQGLKITAQAQSIQSLPTGMFDHILLDPPRSGADPIIDNLAQSSSKKMTYISCNPAVLARDLKHLVSAGWVVQRLRLFHLFPHSGHAEVYCLLGKF